MSRFALFVALFLFVHAVGLSQGVHRTREGGTRAQGDPCFDAGDAKEIRLWQSRAPGAIGDDPCRDVPYLRIFRPALSSRKAIPAIVVIPGGGYDRLTDAAEQAPVAAYFASQLHVVAFVLRYRLVRADGTYRYPAPVWDAQRAIRLLRARAHEYDIDPDRIGVFGFSAGGHLASTIALHPRESFGVTPVDEVDRSSAEVNLLGLGYPVISMNPAAVPPSGSYRNLLSGFRGSELGVLQHLLSGEENVTQAAPPVFLFESLDDKTISPLNSQLFAAALEHARIPASVHLFPHGKHGSGLSIGIPEESAWPALFVEWVMRQWPES